MRDSRQRPCEVAGLHAGLHACVRDVPYDKCNPWVVQAGSGRRPHAPGMRPRSGSSAADEQRLLDRQVERPLVRELPEPFLKTLEQLLSFSLDSVTKHA